MTRRGTRRLGTRLRGTRRRGMRRRGTRRRDTRRRDSCCRRDSSCRRDSRSRRYGSTARDSPGCSRGRHGNTVHPCSTRGWSSRGSREIRRSNMGSPGNTETHRSNRICAVVVGRVRHAGAVIGAVVLALGSIGRSCITAADCNRSADEEWECESTHDDLYSLAQHHACPARRFVSRRVRVWLSGLHFPSREDCELLAAALELPLPTILCGPLPLATRLVAERFGESGRFDAQTHAWRTGCCMAGNASPSSWLGVSRRGVRPVRQRR